MHSTENLQSAVSSLRFLEYAVVTLEKTTPKSELSSDISTDTSQMYLVISFVIAKFPSLSCISSVTFSSNVFTFITALEHNFDEGDT